jgi:catechol 2,3-dioxygenase
VHLSGKKVRVGMADHLVSEAIYLTDPDGLGLAVYADRPRETWPHRGRELLMATEPLGAEALTAAGAGRDWGDGAPAGTVMGHVHLHVGDLRAASAFYHEALGFDETVRGYPGALFFSAGGYHHHLGTNTWSPGPAAGEDQARLLEWELVVPTREAAAGAAASLRTAGHEAEETGQGWRAADPWGTRVRIAAAADAIG